MVIKKKIQPTHPSFYTKYKCLCELLLSARSYPGNSQSRTFNPLTRTFNPLHTVLLPQTHSDKEENRSRAVCVVPATDFLGLFSLAETALLVSHTAARPPITQPG